MNEQIGTSGDCYTLVQPDTLRDRIRRKLFPHREPRWPTGLNSPQRDCLVTRTVAELSIVDRLRVLLTGRLLIESRTLTENVIGNQKTESAFTALAPKWME